MSENEEIMNETENETMAAEVEAVETVETEAAEVEAADEVSAEEEAEVVEAAVDYDDEELMDKMQKAARLLRSRRFAISKEEEAKAERMANIERAIKLLDLKPKMEQKEMSDLLGMRLRELDGLMAEAEAADLVGRIDDAEGDMRKIVVFAAEDAAEGLVELANKKEKLLPELSYEEATELMAALDKVIAPLVAMGLDEDGGPRGGRDDRGGRGGDRGGRGGFGDRGGRGGDRGGRGGDRGGRGGVGERGGRGGEHREGTRGNGSRSGAGRSNESRDRRDPRASRDRRDDWRNYDDTREERRGGYRGGRGGNQAGSRGGRAGGRDNRGSYGNSRGGKRGGSSRRPGDGGGKRK